MKGDSIIGSKIALQMPYRTLLMQMIIQFVYTENKNWFGILWK